MMTDEVPGRGHYSHPLLRGVYGIFETSDGWIGIIGVPPDARDAFFIAMGQPELAENERYATHGARGTHQQELDDLISEWSKNFSSAELRELLNDFGVPNGKIYTAADMLEDAHYAARNAIVTLDHPEFGDFKMHNVFPRMSETQGKVRWPGPTLGQHNDEIFRERLGLDEQTMSEYQEKGII